MSRVDYLFTSESVTEGHPDKLADQISDAVLDAYLAQDSLARVACETSVTTGLVLLFGEISANAQVNAGRVARTPSGRWGIPPPRPVLMPTTARSSYLSTSNHLILPRE